MLPAPDPKALSRPGNVIPETGEQNHEQRQTILRCFDTGNVSVSPKDEVRLHSSRKIRRRSFLKGLGVSGVAATLGTGIIAENAPLFAEEGSGSLTKGDAAILRFLAAAEIIESDIW
jgi:TAT (twin-arginine translocation) pathway signal sequence